MSKCPVELVDAAADDRLSSDDVDQLQSHLSSCEVCCQRLETATASPQWWNDASRLLDDSLLDDPLADTADSSASDARLFEDDDPVGELKAAGVINTPTHPEMLGMLGRYSIEREIGSGGMGVVLKGYDADLNRTVAIKVLAPHLARSAAAKQRFIREGRAAAAVVHENIVAIHEVDTSGRLPTLVMHYVDGVSLQRHVDTIGPLPVCDALRIAAQTAAGLSAAHRQGIIHRDVKPANILVGGGGGRVWITDFGLARAVDDASLTRTGFIAGTPHYMSPEQARGGSVGPVSDLFSLGAVIYFMLAARPPWRAERSLAVLHRIVQHPHRPLWQVNPDVPREVSDLVDRMLAKDPELRGESATTVQRELEDMLSQLQNPDSPHSLSSDGSTVQPKKRLVEHPLFLVPITAAVTTLLIFMPTWIERYSKSATTADKTNQTKSEPRDLNSTRPEQASKRFSDYEKVMRQGPAKVKATASKTQFDASPPFPEASENGFEQVSEDSWNTPAIELNAPSAMTLPGTPSTNLSLPPITDTAQPANTLPRNTPPVTQQNAPPVYSSIGDDIWSEILELDELLNTTEAMIAPQNTSPTPVY